MNLEALDAWLEPLRLSAELMPVVELARTLAAELDGDQWTAPVADQYLKTLDALAGRLAEDGAGDGAADVRRALSAVGD